MQMQPNEYDTITPTAYTQGNDDDETTHSNNSTNIMYQADLWMLKCINIPYSSINAHTIVNLYATIW